MRFMARMARELGLIGVLVGMVGYGVAVADEDGTYSCCSIDRDCRYVDREAACGDGQACPSSDYQRCCVDACTLPNLD
jgi:hypothetical protein